MKLESPGATVIRNEVSNVCTALRRNARWSSRNSFTSALLYEAAPAALLPPSSSSTNTNTHSNSYAQASSTPASASSARSRAQQQQHHHTSTQSGSSKSDTGKKRDIGPALFAELQLELKQIHEDTNNIDALILLNPFLDIVRSGDTSGPITSVALAAIDKFILLDLLHPSSPSLLPALQQLSEAATHCKFEASDSVSDELVLLRIQDVLLHALTGPLGPHLSDEAVCGIMETVLGMCCQMRLSEMLRKTAEKTMHHLVRTVFARLRSWPAPKQVSRELQPSTPTSRPAMPRHVSDVSISAPDPKSLLLPTATNATSAALAPPEEAASPVGHGGASTPKANHQQQAEISPYGVQSVTELLRVLIDLLDPFDNNHTDSMRLLSVNLLNTVFEVGGSSIGRFPALRSMVGDRLCKFLLQLASTSSVNNSQFQILLSAASLHLWTHLLHTLQPHLKLQQELLLSFLMDRLAIVPGREAELDWDKKTWDATLNDLNPAPPMSPASPLTPLAAGGSSSSAGVPDRSASSSPTPSAFKSRAMEQQNSLSPEVRALLLEHLCLFAREPDTALVLWQNYDCQLDSEDLWERLVRFFSRGVYPTASMAVQSLSASTSSAAASIINETGQDATQLMCLDTVLAFVGHMAERTESQQGDSAEQREGAGALANDKQKKQVLLRGAELFNTKPKLGLAFWQEQGVLYADCGVDAPSEQKAASLARFLLDCPRLDKREIGDYISRPDQLELLNAFIRMFDFTDKIISDAMRELLETFRLPGESQQINRITEVFAEVYFHAQSDKTVVRSQDAVYVLAYSVIMLNTDQHNPQNVKNRMKLDDYRRNLRGVNDGQDFSPEYLGDIYTDIKQREIVLPEEHQGNLGFDFAWRELLKRSQSTKPLRIVRSLEQDRELFKIGWKPVVSAIAYAFTHFKDETVLDKALVGFQQLADLASRFDLPEVFDQIILALARITELSPGPANIDTATFPKVEVPIKSTDKHQEIIISPLSVRFGTNIKAQLAAVVLFSIANNNGAAIRTGWIHIIEVYQTLFLHSLLPGSLLSMEDFLAGTSAIPLKPREPAVVREERRSDGGLLSTLSSYLLSPNATNAGTDGLGREMTEDDIDDTLSTVDCIASCRLEELYAGILHLPEDSLAAIMEALNELLHKGARQRQGSTDSLHSGRVNTGSRMQAPYDPAVVFLLELMVGIASGAPHALEATWPIISNYVHEIVSFAASYSAILVERAVVGLLRIASTLAQQEHLQAQFIEALEMLQLLPTSVISSVAEQMTAGLIHIVSNHHASLKSSQQWELVFSFFASTAHRNDAAKASFELLRTMLYQSAVGGLTPQNYVPFVETLNAFSSAAGARDAPGSTHLQTEPLVERGRVALDMIRDSQSFIHEVTAEDSLTFPIAWQSYWLPVLSKFSQQCTNACRDIRQAALGHLQRTLIAYEILSNPEINLSLVFERLVFPMLDELLKPQVFRRDPAGMGETRLRAAALLCKIFLHCATQRQDMAGLLPIWGRVLDALDRMMHSGRRDAMYEAVPEQLKNAVLVMAAQDILVPPSAPSRTKEQVDLWDATFTRIDTFLPTLQQELFPNTPALRPTKIVDFSSRSPDPQNASRKAPPSPVEGETRTA